MAAVLVVAKETGRSFAKQRIFRDRTTQLDSLSDEELYARYRMDRRALFVLLDAVRPQIEYPTRRSHILSPETQLLLTLRFVSKGGFLMEMGDLHGCHQSSVSRAFHKTVSVIVDVLDNINFPRDLKPVMCSFYKIAGMPKVIGAIDGTLIPIKRPHGDDESAYVCRKGYHAINVQAVCDASLRFTNVVAKWPGASHDSMILNNSIIGQQLEDNPTDGWLLGDSGYACRPWLLTPIHTPESRSEQKYNGAHCKTRNVVERAFGVLKSRFRCLHKSAGCLQFQPARCANTIMACFKLHNFCLDQNLPQPAPIEDDTSQDEQYHGPVVDGHAIRQTLIQNYF